MEPSFAKSEVEFFGAKGTYKTTYGGIGLAYQMPDGDTIVKSGGNGFYYPVENLDSFVRDGGKGYREAVRELAPVYKR